MRKGQIEPTESTIRALVEAGDHDAAATAALRLYGAEISRCTVGTRAPRATSFRSSASSSGRSTADVAVPAVAEMSALLGRRR